MSRTFVFAVIALLWVPQIHAGLSEDESMITRDNSNLGCKYHTVTDVGTYRLHVMHRSDGSTINEYASSQGKVFAVSWDGGRRHPDLTKLLGLHTEEYQAANPLVPSHARGVGARGRVGNGKRIVATTNIIVENGGRVGHVKGRAWVPKLIPDGVNADDIQ